MSELAADARAAEWLSKCLLQNKPVIQELHAHALGDGWKHEFGFGIRPDCSATETVKGVAHNVNIPGDGYRRDSHTYPLAEQWAVRRRSGKKPNVTALHAES
jgi:hypothetical protein